MHEEVLEIDIFFNRLYHLPLYILVLRDLLIETNGFFLFILFKHLEEKNVRLGDVFELILVQKREESELVILPCLICWFSDSNLSGSLIWFPSSCESVIILEY